MPTKGREPVTIDGHAVSFGRESVGLPTTWSTDRLVELYLELVNRLRRGRPIDDVREVDVEALARATGLGAPVVRQRILAQLAARRSAVG